MKTFTRIMPAIAIVAALGWGANALADHVRIGGGVVFGGGWEHGGWQIGIGTGGVGVAVGGGYGCMAPAPVYVPAPVVVHHRPIVYRPVVVAAPVVGYYPVVHRPVVVAAPAPVVATYRPRVVRYVTDCRRIAQPMVHDHSAVIEVRAAVGEPWVVVGAHPAIW